MPIWVWRDIRFVLCFFKRGPSIRAVQGGAVLEGAHAWTAAISYSRVLIPEAWFDSGHATEGYVCMYV